MDDPDSDAEMTDVQPGQGGPNPYKNANPGFYDLFGFITHLGASVNAGHYVCHL
jgi:hypothetical protein